MKTYLCYENGDKFTIESPTLEQANTDAKLWGAIVLGEYNPLTNSVKI